MNSGEIKPRKISGAVLLMSIIVILAGLMAAKSIVIPLLLSLFIGVISAYPIRWITSKNIPHWLAVIIVLFGIFITLFFVGGVVGNSVSKFTKEAPKYRDNIEKMTDDFILELEEKGFDVSDQMDEYLEPGAAFDFAATFVSDIGAIIGDSFVILFIVIFMLFEMNSFPIKKAAIEKLRGDSLQYLQKIGESIRHYLAIKTVISLLTGLLVTIATLIIGVDYPVLWGMIAFLFNYIPSIGSIIAAVPAALLALVQLGFSGMVWTIIAYLAVNTLMGNIIEPKVMGKGLGLSTLIVFVSLIVWGFVFGSVGMFLSVPLTMSIKIMLEQNPRTQWMAIMLGTEKDAKDLLSVEQSE